MLGWVTLEDDVLLGPGVQIPSGPHTHGITRLDTPIRNQPGRPNRVSIGRDSWIGAGCIVLADVDAHCVIGANSTITRPIPAHSIAVGSPAKTIRKRTESEDDAKHLASLCDIEIQDGASANQNQQKHPVNYE